MDQFFIYIVFYLYIQMGVGTFILQDTRLWWFTTDTLKKRN